MSGSIDTRIVQMQFQNSEFEKGIKESLKSLEMFKKATEFKDTIKSFDELQKLANSFSLAKMSEGIDAVSKRFSTMGIIGMQILENLTNKAINYGEQMVKSLSIDQITAGWGKYEQKTKAVQQITNATGLSIEEVNEQLNKLTWFSDETSYSFTDMVSNIGKFTSMNIPLDKSVTAMQGISTWAALSGAGVQEASRAMFNLSQAIGLGAVKMQDWKSIALANMATAEFKQTAIDTAIAMGKLKKGAVDVNKFESSLSKGWFTSDVLIAVLEKYGAAASEVYKIAEEQNIPAAQAMALLGDKFDSLGMKAFKAAQEAKTFTEAIEATKDAVSSGWMTTFEMLFGNYEEAKVLWTDLANGLWEIFAAGSEARNEVLQEWHDGGGRETFFEGIYSICNSLLGIIYAVRDAFEEIFPPITVEKLNSVSEKVKELGTNLHKALVWVEIIKSHREALTDTAEGLLNPVKEFKKEFKIGTKGKDDIKEIQTRLEELGFTLDKFGVDGIFGKETEAQIKKFQESMGLAVTGIVDEETFNALFNSDATGFERVVESFRSYGSILTDIGRVAKGVFAIFHIGWTVIKGILTTAGFILKLLSPIFTALLSVAAAVGDIFVGFDKLFAAGDGPLGKFSEKVQQFFAPIGPWAEQAGKDIRTFFGLTDNAPDELITLPKLWNNIKESIKNTGIIDKVKISFDKLKNSLKKIKAPMKKYWEQLKQTFGKKSQELLSSIPLGISNVISWIGDFLSKGIEKLSAWIETIPEKIEKIKSFFKALSMEGDPAANKKPGFLLRVKNALQDVWKWIFGGTGENGEKQKGAFQRILSLVTGDIEGALDGLDETTKENILTKVDGISTFFSKVRSGIYYAITGEKAAGGDDEDQLSKEAYNKIDAWRNSIETFLGTVTGAIEGVYAVIQTLMGGNAASYLKTIGEDGSREKSTALAVYNGVMDFVEAVSLIFTGKSPEGHNGHLSPMTYVALFSWHLKIKSFFDSVGVVLSDIYNALSFIATGDGNKLASIQNDPIAQIAPAIREGIWDAINFVSEIFTGKQVEGHETLSEDTENSISTAKDNIVKFFNTIAGYLTEIWDAIMLIVGDNRPGLDSINNETIKGIAKGINEGIWDTINTISEIFTNNQVSGHESLTPETVKALGDFKRQVGGFFDSVAQTFSDIYHSIHGIVTGNWEELLQVENQDIPATIARFITHVQGIIQRVYYVFTGKEASGLGKLSDETKAKLDNVTGIFTGFFSGVSNGLKSIWDTVSGIISGEITFDTVSSLLDTTFSSIGDFFTGIWDSIKTNVNENVQQAMESIQTFWNEKIKPVFDSIIKFAEDHWLLILVGVVVAKLASAAKNMIDSISSFGSMFGLGTGPAESFASKLLKLALSVGIIAAAIYYLGNMDANALQQGFDKVKEILTWLAEFMAGDFVAGILNKLAEKGFNKLFGQSTGKDKGITQGLEGFAKLLLDIGIGIGIIAFAIIELSKIKEEDFIKGKEKVQQILDMLKQFMIDLFIGGTVANTAAAVNAGLGGSNGFELKGFDQLAGLLLAVAAIFEVVKNFNVTQAVTSIAMLSAVFLEIGLLVKALKDNTTGLTDVNVKGFEGIAWLVAACAAAIYALKDLISLTDENGNFIGWDKALAEGGEKLGPFAIISAFIDSLAAIMRGWNSQKLKGAAGVFWSITALVGVIALAMGTLSSMNIESDFMLSFAESFAIIADGTALLMEGIGQIESWTNKTGAAVKGAASIGAGFAALTAIPGLLLEFVGELNKASDNGLVEGLQEGGKVLVSLADDLATFAGKLDLTWPSIGLIFAGMEAVGLLGAGAMITGAGAVGIAFDALIILVGGLATLAGALNENGELASLIESGGEVFEKLGGAIAGFATGFASGWQEIEKQNIINQNEETKTFGEAITALKEGIGDTSGQEEELKADLDAALRLAEYLYTWFSDMQQYPIDYKAGMTGLTDYATASSQLSTDMTKFGEAVDSFTGAVSGYSAKYGGTIMEDTRTAVEMAEALHTFFSGIAAYPVSGDMFAGWDTAPSQLSKDMPLFGEASDTFAKEIHGYHDKYDDSILQDVETVKTIASAMHDFFSSIEAYGVYYNYNAGSVYTAPSQLSEDMRIFGEAVDTFVNNTSEIRADEKGVKDGTETAIWIAQQISQMLVDLKQYNGDIQTNRGALQQFFAGENTTETIFTSLNELGEAMALYGGVFSDVGTLNISRGIEQGAKALKETASLLNELGQITDPNTFVQGISNLISLDNYISSELPNGQEGGPGSLSLGSLLRRFIDNLTGEEGVSSSELTSAAKILDAANTFFKLLSGEGDVQINTKNFLGDLDADTVITNLSNFTSELGTALSENAGVIEGYANNFNQSGNVLAEQLTGTESISGANRAGKDMGIEAAKGARTKYGSMKSAGNYLGQGFINGIKEYLDDAYNAGKDLANAAKEGEMVGSDSRSPSRVFMKLGGYLSQGLAIGINSESDSAYEAAKNLATGLAGSTGGVLSSLSSILASGIDDAPVIRPVVDLSGARLAAGSVNSMFGDQEFAVKSRMMAGQAINAKTGRPNINQNGSGSVVAAVNGMNDKIGALGDAINGMQLIMDGKALVGHITTLMDKSLGRVAAVRRRMG